MFYGESAMNRQSSNSFVAFVVSVAVLISAALGPTLNAEYCAAADDPKAAPANDGANSLANSPSAADVTKKLSQEELEKKFQDTLSGATLQGHFTSQRDENVAASKEDKYTIDSITKMQGDVWLFNARIQYGTHDLTLPLPLRVVWAGDTPVITLDKFPVPGMGEFTARVMVFDDQYAGMWDGGNQGGLLFGKITKQAAKDNK
jgi:hypothetical protein